MDLVLHQQTNQAFAEALTMVFTASNKGEKLFTIFQDINDKRSGQIKLVLNHYEFVALGVHRKILHEQTLKEMQFSIYTKVWEAACPLIYDLRHESGRDTIFQEFERLATRWKSNPLKAYKK